VVEGDLGGAEPHVAIAAAIAPRRREVEAAEARRAVEVVEDAARDDARQRHRATRRADHPLVLRHDDDLVREDRADRLLPRQGGERQHAERPEVGIQQQRRISGIRDHRRPPFLRKRWRARKDSNPQPPGS
jgi:hypothetical protein